MGFSSFLKGRALFPKRNDSQVKPHGHKQLFRFKRIRCTKSFTSPNNHQKKELTTPGKRVPAFYVVCCCTSLSISEKRTFLIVRNGCQHDFQGNLRDDRNRGTSQNGEKQKSRRFHFTYTNYQIKMCQFGSQVSPHSP